MSGSLEITVVSASLSPYVNFESEPTDTYATLRCNKEQHCTTTAQDQGRLPVWNETFKFNIQEKDVSNDVLVQVFSVGGEVDELLGMARIPIFSMVGKEEGTLASLVNPSKGETGKLKAAWNWKPGSQGKLKATSHHEGKGSGYTETESYPLSHDPKMPSYAGPLGYPHISKDQDPYSKLDAVSDAMAKMHVAKRKDEYSYSSTAVPGHVPVSETVSYPGYHEARAIDERKEDSYWYGSSNSYPSYNYPLQTTAHDYAQAQDAYPAGTAVAYPPPPVDAYPPRKEAHPSYPPSRVDTYPPTSEAYPPHQPAAYPPPSTAASYPTQDAYASQPTTAYSPYPYYQHALPVEPQGYMEKGGGFVEKGSGSNKEKGKVHGSQDPHGQGPYGYPPSSYAPQPGYPPAGYPPGAPHGYPPAAPHGYPPQTAHGYPPEATYGYLPVAPYGYPPAATQGYPPAGPHGYPPPSHGHPPAPQGYPPHNYPPAGYPSAHGSHHKPDKHGHASGYAAPGTYVGHSISSKPPKKHKEPKIFSSHKHGHGKHKKQKSFKGLKFKKFKMFKF